MTFDNFIIASICLAILIFIYIFSIFYSKDRIIFSGSFFNKSFRNILIKNYDTNILRIKKILKFLASIFLIISISGIKSGKTIKPIERKGSDVIFTVDISKSMNAEDVIPSRLDKVKFEMIKTIESLKGDRVGIVVFSGANFLYLPLTLDYDAAVLFTKNIDSQMISLNGTLIPQAISTSVKALATNEGSGKLIFLFSDGEDHNSNDINDSSYYIPENIILNVIGVGTNEGSLVPDDKKLKSFIKNSDGTLVISKVNDDFLSKIAQIGKGEYLRINKSENVSEIINSLILNSEKNTLNNFEFEDFNHRYQYPLFISFLFYLAFYILPSGRQKK